MYYFSKIRSYFGEVVQMFELRRVGDAPKGHPFAPLGKQLYNWNLSCSEIKLDNALWNNLAWMEPWFLVFNFDSRCFFWIGFHDALAQRLCHLTIPFSLQWKDCVLLHMYLLNVCLQPCSSQIWVGTSKLYILASSLHLA